MNKIEIDWTPDWREITNEYGTFLTFNAKTLNERYEKGNYQDDITQLIKSGDYDIFIDVGAYIGYFTVVASNYCKLVRSYEASPLFYGILLHNARFLNNVECKYGWVSSLDAIPKIHDRLFTMVFASKGVNEYNVPVLTLDNELKDILDEKVLIKLDVEGSEVEVLKASTEILKHPNVHWQIDIHVNQGVKREDVFAFLEGREIIDTGINIVVKGAESSE